MRFDWYSATSKVPYAEVLSTLAGTVPGVAIDNARPLYGYRQAVSVKAGGDLAASIMWGGPSMGEGCHIQASGINAHSIAQALREQLPGHVVTRADVAHDIVEPGVFDRYTNHALAVADAHAIKVQHQGDWHRAQDGRTLYVGAASSPVRMRIYEKGIQLGQDRDWVRAEAQVRPKGTAARVWAAKAAPEQFFGVSSWLLEFAKQVAISLDETDRKAMGTVYVPSSDERAYAWMLRQYGSVLSRMLEDLGSAEMVGRQLFDDLRKLKGRR